MKTKTETEEAKDGLVTEMAVFLHGLEVWRDQYLAAGNECLENVEGGSRSIKANQG